MIRGMKGANAVGTALGRVVVAAGFLLGAVGCQTTSGAQARAAAPAALTAAANPGFTIAFDAGGCPTSATPSTKNCPNGQADCLYVQGGQKVQFTSSPTTPFTLSFDPFAASTIPVDSGSVTLTAAMHGNQRHKPYTFIVTGKPGCKPLDPQIILD